MPIGLGLGAATAGATGGMSLLPMLLGTLGGGVLSGSFFGGESPKDEAMKAIMEQIQAYLPELAKTPITASELAGIVQKMKGTARGAASVSAGATGKALAESLGASGTPQGQPSGEIYTAEMSPVIAQGEMQANDIDKFGLEFLNNMDAQSKSKIINALQMLMQSAGGQPDMTNTQRGIAAGLQGADLFASGIGNLASAYKDMNYKSIKP